MQSPKERIAALAEEGRFVPLSLSDWRMRGFVRQSSAVSPTVTVYIESDGAPWLASDLPPRDPTPIRPYVVRMASADPAPAVAYLGRPCQQLEPEQLHGCDPQWWIQARYSESVVSATNEAVSAAKARTGAQEVKLVGYSGGGTVAALVAERRDDVACLVTVAAPLDTEAWTQTIGVSPLSRSLNPASGAERLARVPQTHFRGGKDSVVPPATGRQYLRQTPNARVIDLPRSDHDCCWADDWRELRAQSCLAESR